jgi:hypothetical protein
MLESRFKIAREAIEEATRAASLQPSQDTLKGWEILGNLVDVYV